jgi:biopolymer transport protein ExbD
MSQAIVRAVPQAEINITPLVDVMLVLLVIFMIAMPALSQSLPLGLGRGGESRTEPLRLSVGADAVLRLDGEAIAPAELQARLQELLRRDPQLKLQVLADPEAGYGEVARALGLARNAGVEHLAVPTR